MHVPMKPRWKETIEAWPDSTLLLQRGLQGLEIYVMVEILLKEDLK